MSDVNTTEQPQPETTTTIIKDDMAAKKDTRLADATIFLGRYEGFGTLPFNTAKETFLCEVPLILQGSEKYNRCHTVSNLSLILAFNLLTDKRKLAYEKHMKPVDKKGVNKGKFQTLSTSELKLCSEEAKRIVSAFAVYDGAIQDEKTRNEMTASVIKEGFDAKKVSNSCNETEAIKFLKTEPMAAILDQYRKIHHGDEDALHTVIWGYCVKWLKEAADEGIHIIAVGTRGTGKSHGITTAMSFLPPELALIQGISARFLYYSKDITRGMTIYLDELPSDQSLIDCLKSIITSYPNGGTRGTVINHVDVTQTIPARVTINTSSVDQTADEQFTNRMTVIRAHDDKASKEARVKFRMNLYEGSIPETDPEKIISIHNALRYISTKNFVVLLPKGAVVADNYTQIDMRVLNQFYDAMIGNAILNFPSRIKDPVFGDDIYIEVTEEDFNAVIHLYQDPNHYHLKLTDAAVIIKNYLEKIYPAHTTIGDIASSVNTSTQTVRNTLIGRKDRNIETLISAGFAEEVTLSEQEKEVYVDGRGNERPRTVGERLSSKAYRATQNPTATKPNLGQKGDDIGQANLASIVGMLRWNQDPKKGISQNVLPSPPANPVRPTMDEQNHTDDILSNPLGLSDRRQTTTPKGKTSVDKDTKNTISERIASLELQKKQFEKDEIPCFKTENEILKLKRELSKLSPMVK